MLPLAALSVAVQSNFVSSSVGLNAMDLIRKLTILYDMKYYNIKPYVHQLHTEKTCNLPSLLTYASGSSVTVKKKLPV
jgi:hypothetical protein